MSLLTQITQQSANLLSFFEDVEMIQRRDALLRVIDKMNENGVVWALSCSGSLYFRGLVDEYNDYDIVVEKDSIDKFFECFKELGGEICIEPNGKEQYFCSKVFAWAKLDGVDFDIISGFTVRTFGTQYCYDLKKEHIDYVRNIPVCPVEANLLLYGMMLDWQPKRRFKYEIAKAYLKENGVHHKDIFDVMGLPAFIIEDIEGLHK